MALHEGSLAPHSILIPTSPQFTDFFYSLRMRVIVNTIISIAMCLAMDGSRVIVLSGCLLISLIGYTA